MMDPHEQALDLQDIEGELTEWEREFVASILERLDEGRDLTDAQIDKLDQIYEENC